MKKINIYDLILLINTIERDEGLYMNKIQVMCESLNYAEGKLSDEFLFTIHMADLFYYKNNIGVMDIKAGFVDGRSDGGIDFIFANQETMYLLQG